MPPTQEESFSLFFYDLQSSIFGSYNVAFKRVPTRKRLGVTKAVGEQNLDRSEGKEGVEVKDAKVEVKKNKNTIAELDEELRLRLEGISGEGGNAGIEYVRG